MTVEVVRGENAKMTKKGIGKVAELNVAMGKSAPFRILKVTTVFLSGYGKGRQVCERACFSTLQRLARPLPSALVLISEFALPIIPTTIHLLAHNLENFAYGMLHTVKRDTSKYYLSRGRPCCESTATLTLSKEQPRESAAHLHGRQVSRAQIKHDEQEFHGWNVELISTF